MAELETESRSPSLSWVNWYRDSVLLLALAIVFSLDQTTKALVRHNLVLGESIPRDGPFRIVHSFNTGSAFGLFPNQTLFLILASLVGIVILLLVYRNQSLAGFPIRLSLGMQIGGALGNLSDRVRTGEVTDFIDVGFWPVFNVADAAIVTGIILLAGVFLLTDKAHKDPPIGGPAPAALAPGRERSPFIPRESRIVDENGVRYGKIGGLESLVDLPCMVCGSMMRQVPGGWACRVCGAKKLVREGESW